MIIALVIACCLLSSLSAYLFGTLWQVKKQQKLEQLVSELQAFFSQMQFDAHVASYINSLGFSTNGASHVHQDSRNAEDPARS